jgi:hypothetical protein
VKSKKAFAAPTAVPQLSRLAHVQAAWFAGWHMRCRFIEEKGSDAVALVTLVVNSAKNRYNPATEPAAGAPAVFLPADDRS